MSEKVENSIKVKEPYLGKKVLVKRPPINVIETEDLCLRSNELIEKSIRILEALNFKEPVSEAQH